MARETVVKPEWENIDLEEDDLGVGDKVSEAYNKKGKPLIKRVIKRTITRIFIILVALIVGICTFSFVSFCWVDMERQAGVVRGLNNVDGTIYVNGQVDSTLVNRMQNYIGNLPPSIHEAVMSDWVVLLADTPPSSLFRRSFVNINDYDTSGMILAGYTFTQTRVVYVNSKLGADAAYNAFVHEMGHVISFEFASAHGTKEWEDLFNTYRYSFKTESYNLSNEVEFFANAYFEYYDDEEALKQKSPEIHQFFDTLLRKEVPDNSFAESFMAGIDNTFNTLRVYYYYFVVER